MDLQGVFQAAKRIVARTYGPFRATPDGITVEQGLIEEGRAGYTRSTIPTHTEDGEIVLDEQAHPEKIAIDEGLVKHDPTAAGKVLVHELIEWRAAEELPAVDVRDGKTDTVAEFGENHICRELNDEVGEAVCDVEWGRQYDT